MLLLCSQILCKQVAGPVLLSRDRRELVAGMQIAGR